MDEKKQSGDGTYVVKKNKKVSVLAFIGCFVLAFFIWIYVANAKISDNTKTFSVKLNIKGESTLFDKTGYTVFGSSEAWVKVTVQGTKADILKYSENDFSVYIDVTNIEKPGITPLNIVVEAPSGAITVNSMDPVQTTVLIDEMVNDRKIAVMSDAEEKVGYIKVSGPKTHLEKISYAKIVNDGVTSSSKAVFYDATDSLVESSYIIYDMSETQNQQGE